MYAAYIKNIIKFFLLLLLQVMTLNYIHLFGVATPLLYIVAAMGFPRNLSKTLILFTCFLMGLITDICSGTPGIATFSMTFIGALQPYLVEIFSPRDSLADLIPGIRQFGLFPFTTFIFILSTIYCMLYFAIETFHFFDPLLWLTRFAGSSLLTTIIIVIGHIPFAKGNKPKTI